MMENLKHDFFDEDTRRDKMMCKIEKCVCKTERGVSEI